MAKLFKITTDQGTWQFTAAQYLDARYLLLPYVHAYGVEDAQQHVQCALYGEAATPAEFLQACDDMQAAWVERKSLTHVYRRVLYGSSSSYVWKWIPKD